jgi:hypothetical protein
MEGSRSACVSVTCLFIFYFHSYQRFSAIQLSGSNLSHFTMEAKTAVTIVGFGYRAFSGQPESCPSLQLACSHRISRENAKRSEVHRAPDRKVRRVAKEKGATDKNVFVQIGVNWRS